MMKLLNKHGIFERNSILLLVGILLMVSIGGLVEIVPLFYLENTIEDVVIIRFILILLILKRLKLPSE